MRDGSAVQRDLVANAIRNADINALADVIEIVKDTGALELSMKRASVSSTAAISALGSLSPSPYRDALECIAVYSFNRTL